MSLEIKPLEGTPSSLVETETVEGKLPEALFNQERLAKWKKNIRAVKKLGIKRGFKYSDGTLKLIRRKRG